MSVKWTEAQLNAIESRNGTLLVSAAAGSGKTAVLVERLLRRVQQEKCDIDKFLMITYTNAAASELRAKIVEALTKKVAENPEDRHLARQMNLVYRASISTIHAYCMQVIRTHGHYLGISGDFKIIDENEADVLRRRALEDLLEQKYQENSEGFRALCDSLADAKSDRRMAETILKLHSKSRSHPNSIGWLKSCARMYKEGSDIWEKQIMAHVGELCEYLKARIDVAISELKSDSAIDAAYTPAFLSDKSNLEAMSRAKTWDELYTAANSVDFMRLSAAKGCEDEELREWAKEERNSLKKELAKICEKFLCKDKNTMHCEVEALAPVVCELCEITIELDKRFGQLKNSRNVLDYSDLEHKAVALLVENYDEEKDQVVPTALANEISNEFIEIMVDEYQDSNCIQDIIFRAISKEEKNLTMVGDLKQSIYRFRLADPTIFLRKYKSFKDFKDATDGEPRVVNLSQNFRSRIEVLDTCNRYFVKTMTEQLGELNYTRREYLNLGASYEKSNLNCESELVVINLNEKDQEDDEADLQVRQEEAKYIASRIRDLANQGVPYGDVVILLRSLASRASIYENALKAYGIPCVSEKKGGLLGTVEVGVIISFLQIIDNPLWDIPLVSVLRSPLFAFTADDLASIRRHKKGVFFEALQESARDEGELAVRCARFLELLAELRDLSGEVGVDELIWQLLDKTLARGLFGAMEEGNVRVSNLNEFYRYAERFESQEYRGLHAFLSHIAHMTEQGNDISADNGESSSGSVKIMSIHKSKGLEFPIVFLADCNREFNEKDLQEQILIHPKFGLGLNFRDNKLRYECPSIARLSITLALKNEMRSEELRILYVAMTRAREKLIVVCTEKDAWKKIRKAENTVLNGAVSPVNLINSTNADMWFLMPQIADKSMFKMRVEDVKNIAKPADYNSASSDSSGADEGKIETLSARFSYKYPFESSVNTEGKATATGLAHKNLKIRSHFVRPSFEKKRGLTATEKGIAIHLAMQLVDFAKCGTLSGVKNELERLLADEYLTKEQYEAIDENKIYAFFESELGAIVKKNRCRREFNFSRLIPTENGDSVLLQGVVDLMVECDEGIVIVDFKSDRTINEDNTSSYKEQLNVYSEAVEAIFKRKVAGCYLYFIQQEKTIKL